METDMPSLLQEKQIALKTIGMEITDKSSIQLLKPLNIEKCEISKDEQGFYNVINLPVKLQKKGELFNGEEKILSWHLSQDDNLILDIYCKEQVNVWDQFNFNNVYIHAKGPLFLGEAITCASNMIIKAQSLVFNEAVHCGQNLVAEIEQGMGFLASVTCNKCITRTGAIYQFAALEVKEHVDFACSIYSSSHHSELVSPNLRILAESIFIGGQAAVNNMSFIVANKLILGVLEHKNSVLFAGKIHIKVDYLECHGSAQIEINANEHLGNIQVNTRLDIDSEVNFKVENVKLYFDRVTLNGQLLCVQSQLSSNRILNRGGLHFHQGSLAINQSYTADGSSILRLDETHALIQESQCNNGALICHKSAIVGKKHYVQQGSFTMEAESTLCLTEELYTSKKSSFKIANSTV